ncbi:hypothetical protein B4966_15085 [Rhodocyclaceae bacterium]|nr:hypothetical protein B4966_15085 [Rhodocyclaceae bacterium]
MPGKNILGSRHMQNSWRVLSLLAPPRAVRHEYPLDALGPLAEVAREISNGIQCSPALAGQSVLAAAALLTQGVANVLGADGRAKPLSIYALTIAQSGDGKDSADGVAFRAIREWQRDATHAYRRIMARLGKDDVPPPEPYRVTRDITVEGLRRAYEKGVSSQGVFSTEAATVLVGHALSQENRIKTCATLCGLWDGTGFSVARAGMGRFERYGTRLSMHLMAQPAAISEVMSDAALLHIGFWPRFVLVWPEPLQPRRYRPFQPETSPAIREFWQRCSDLLQIPLQDDNDKHAPLELEKGAVSVLAEFLEECELRARRGDWQPIQPFGLRGAELAVRIAGVQTAFVGADGISAESMERSIALVRHSLLNWMTAIEGGHADSVAAHAMTMYEWLLSHGQPIKPGDILRLGPAALRSKSRRDAVLDRLAETGLVMVSDGMVTAVPLDADSANPANVAKTRLA